MKKTEAAKILRNMIFTIQKFRSNSLEEGLEEKVLEMVQPYMFGPKNVLPTLIKAMDDYDQTGDLAPMAFYNFMVIQDRLMHNALSGVEAFYDIPPFPEPNVSWVANGWDK